MNSYTMKETLEIADKAYADIEKFLLSKKETIAVINVENDKDFQKKDIDLLWIFKKDGSPVMKKIEIKGDRYARTGNFFIETVSNESKNTPGCFLYTEADYIFYYFVETRELNVLPVEECKEWFLENIDRFEEKRLSTKVGFDGYSSSGRIVPKTIMRKEVKGIKHKTILH